MLLIVLKCAWCTGHGVVRGRRWRCTDYCRLVHFSGAHDTDDDDRWWRKQKRTDEVSDDGIRVLLLLLSESSVALTLQHSSGKHSEGEEKRKRRVELLWVGGRSGEKPKLLRVWSQPSVAPPLDTDQRRERPVDEERKVQFLATANKMLRFSSSVRCLYAFFRQPEPAIVARASVKECSGIGRR